MTTLFEGFLDIDLSEEDLDNYLDNLTKQDAIKLIKLVFEYCNTKSIFTINESHVVYKIVKKISNE